jgi:hypothetical protein
MQGAKINAYPLEATYGPPHLVVTSGADPAGLAALAKAVFAVPRAEAYAEEAKRPKRASGKG